MEDPQVQEWLLTLAYQLVLWLDTLDYTHFIAMTVCFGAGYWLRGRDKEKKHDPKA